MPSADQSRGYVGPVKRHTYKQRGATFCATCRCLLSAEARDNGRWWCDACADPDGYTWRLADAQEEAKVRLQEAYPAREVRQPALFEEGA